MIASGILTNTKATADLSNTKVSCDFSIESPYIDHVAFGIAGGLVYGVTTIDGTFYAYGIKREYE